MNILTNIWTINPTSVLIQILIKRSSFVNNSWPVTCQLMQIMIEVYRPKTLHECEKLWKIT